MAESGKLPDARAEAERLFKLYPDEEYPMYVSFYMGEASLTSPAGALAREIADIQKRTLSAIAAQYPFGISAKELERLAEEAGRQR